MTELIRIKEILVFQEVLNSLGSEDVRSHFENGMHGAPVRLLSMALLRNYSILKTIPLTDCLIFLGSYQRNIESAG